ncbi:malate dehydrogenase-like [Odontomachus brunneus]|uniref:malate dehydrogenase-like n=1 Tax=Odontomachus brunneus TaxID=486640 RepID=UPI0013F1A51C|nr:malate dehydrogenase-like [Odontomachus brunneus]XP_032689173.1 malate dehydrogenase-like [Odontomachus brunneus]
MYNSIKLFRKFFTKTGSWMTFNRLARMKSYYIRKRDELKYIRRCRVAIVGIGKVGKSLAYLLKMYLSGLMKLRLSTNRNNLEGITEELNISTKLSIREFKYIDRLPWDLKSVDTIVVTIGVSKKPNMHRRHLFVVILDISNYRFIIVMNTATLWILRDLYYIIIFIHHYTHIHTI